MEGNSTCKKVDMNFTNIFLPAVYSGVFIFGLIGNCWGLHSIYTNWRKLGNVNIFVLNLCMADILHLLTLPFLVDYYKEKSMWRFGQAACKLIRFSFNMNLYGSIGFLTCISLYRYLGIVHTLKVNGRITVGHSIAVSSLVWLLVFLQSLPELLFEKTSRNITKCYDTTSNRQIQNYMKYSIGHTIIGFVIPLIILLVCYGHIALVLATKKNVEALLKSRCLRLVLILVLLFSVCFIPFHIFRNLNLSTRLSKLQNMCRKWYANVYIANQISHGLACMNSAIDPLLYLHVKVY
ncbi:P2Y purinoceptor 1 [Chanos chanos]|uniref:P2Y purinoceptor 1 n=1 Tax=Chanos chanos TaxID=29144 RepID=A0A6J2UU08_CHACN|nr:P2Y purinoceptor 1-like [Chanos chanos]